ncbi:MAG: ATP-dependent sacrificial sulfur transferase LarE [Chloroflexi bacterium]|nr:ATP-dependent sacrificial sulfur transferase LarE [Chloroflexota bacterium]MBV9898524.1 ATP-dependent sacrificial sulfur transferase LarE [Chloroflexota bacterium]
MTDLGLDRLREVIRSYGSAITAFSAGVDSTLVAVVAQQELGANALAATAVSASLAPSELEDAVALAATLGLNHRFVATHEVEDSRYATNPVDRCYFCKTHLYTELESLAREVGAKYILNGLNVDDLGDWRPGARAAAERESYVRSPLHEAGMGKAEIRQAARQLGLPNWDKPALACLSSRVPYGLPVTPEKLARIGQAEAMLRNLGFRQLRVRHFDDRARVEIAPNELARVAAEGLATRIEADLLALGFPAVEIDPRGYRSGSLNEGVVPLPVISA